MTDAATVIDRLRPDRVTALWGALVVNVELLLVAAYLAFASVRVTNPLILVYPFVWINLGIWAVATTVPSPASRRSRRIAAAAAVGYFGLLAAVGGVVGPGHALHGHSHATGLRIAFELPPGWGPAVLYSGALVRANLLPYKVVGYLALAYLVYTTVLDAAGSAVAGLVGLLSCVSCTWPVLGTLAAGVFGGTSAVAAVALDQSYGLSTLVFASAVALLYWRPLR